MENLHHFMARRYDRAGVAATSDGGGVPIPAFLAEGFLPPGIHICTAQEIEERFGVVAISQVRADLWAKFLTFIAAVRPANFVSAFIDGSFVTDKIEPGDIDAVFELPPPTPAALGAVKLAFSTILQAKATYKVHFFFCGPGGSPGPNGDLVDFFQSLKPEEAVDRNVPAGTRRGILRLAL